MRIYTIGAALTALPLITGVSCGISEPATTNTEPATPPTSLERPPTGTVSIFYRVYEEDRDCWGVREVFRPSETWAHWATQCSDNIGRQRVYWITEGEGHCGHFGNTLTGDWCRVDDETGWFTECDPNEHACCAAGQPEHTGFGGGTPVPGCMPDPYYQP